jgi:hypothetical protein
MSKPGNSSAFETRGTLFWRVIVLVTAAAAGAGLLGIRALMRGSADPFQADWPMDLWSGSFVATFMIASLSRAPLIAAFGLFLGLVTFMLVDGSAEYPVSSVIAIAIHGLVPALVAALLAIGIQSRHPLQGAGRAE